jgi:hypothetical protein
MITESQAAPSGTTPSDGAAQSGTTPSVPQEFSSFLGVEPETLPSLQPEQKPEPTGAEAEPQAEAGAEAEVEEQPAEAEAGAQAEELPALEETDDDWLLTTEQKKEFPDDQLAEYARRRGYNWEQIQGDKSLKRLLQDKLNSDILIAQQRQAEADEGFFGTGEEQQLPEEEAAAEAEPAPQVDPRQEYYAGVDRLVQQYDQSTLKEMGNGLLNAMGVQTDDKFIGDLTRRLEDPNLPPQTRAEIQQHVALARSSEKIGQTLARYGTDLTLTLLRSPEIIQQAIETVAPGMLGAFQEAQSMRTCAQAWAQVRGRQDQQGRQVYENLPAYGTPEFRALVYKAERQLGLGKDELGSMTFRDAYGNPLPADQNALRGYALVARVASGQKVTPRAVTQAVQAGRRQEQTQQQRRAAGRALGAGATSRQFEQPAQEDAVGSALRQAILDQNESGRILPKGM